MSKQRVGTVSAINPARAWARVIWRDLDNIESDWLPIAQANTLKNHDYCLLDIGERVICSMDDRLEAGVILCAIYDELNLPPVADKNKRYVQFSDGAWFEYDRSRSQLTVRGVKTVVVQASASITFDTPLVNITGDLQVDGAIHADNDIVADTVSLQNHITSKVVPGLGESGKPVQ
ncbi:MAG: phage baseplate assembly protein V [Oceanospirillaceae bacterium]|nr:phage baseplate assembly protein V [Oceanospirillaceae bacterium]